MCRGVSLCERKCFITTLTHKTALSEAAEGVEAARARQSLLESKKHPGQDRKQLHCFTHTKADL